MPGFVLRESTAVSQSTLNNSQKFQKLSNCLLQLETSVKYSAQLGEWRGSRDSWTSRVKEAAERQDIIQLYHQAKEMERCLEYKSQRNEWKHFQRDAVLQLFYSPQFTASPSHLALFISELEDSIGGWGHHEDSWKNGGRKRFWQDLDSVTDPAEVAAFSFDIVKKISKIPKGSYASFAAFAQGVSACSYTLMETAADSASCHENCSRVKRGTGAGGIVAGIYTLGGIALAPFSAGASLALTAAGVAGGVGCAVTGAGAAIYNDNAQKNAAEKLDHLVIVQDVHILIFAIRKCSMYGEQIRDFLEAPAGKKWFCLAKDAALATYKGATGVMTTVNAVKVIELAATLSPKLYAEIAGDIATQLASPGLGAAGFKISGEVMEVITGNNAPLVLLQSGTTGAKCLGVLGGLAGIGFGIWDIIAADADLKKGSEVARVLKHTASNMREAMPIIRSAWAPQTKANETCPCCRRSVVFNNGFSEGCVYTCPHEGCKKTFQKIYCPECSDMMYWSGSYVAGWNVTCSSCKHKFIKVPCPHCNRVNVWKGSAANKYKEGQHSLCAYADCGLPIQQKACPSCNKINWWKNGDGKQGATATCCYEQCRAKFTL